MLPHTRLILLQSLLGAKRKAAACGVGGTWACCGRGVAGMLLATSLLGIFRLIGQGCAGICYCQCQSCARVLCPDTLHAAWRSVCVCACAWGCGCAAVASVVAA